MNSRSKKGKNIHAQGDILSELPRDVLHQILESMPLKDAARMCVLSHKWKDLWISIPSLVFDEQILSNISKTRILGQKCFIFGSIVSSVLLQHEGPILKFSIRLPYLEHSWYVTQWVSYLSKKGIKEVSVFNNYNGVLKLSSHLYFCHDLENLKLQGFIFSPPPNFRGFPKLTMLALDQVEIDYSTLRDLIGNCPVLQNLSLTNIAGMRQKDIIIDAPNLKSLVIDCAIDSLDVKNGENLVSASIIVQNFAVKPAMVRLNDLINFLANSSKLEILGLGGLLCKAVFKGGHHPNTYPKIKNLELLSIYLEDADYFYSTISCIQSFPNIRRLVISVIFCKYADEYTVEVDCSLKLHHLRCVEVTIRQGSSIELKLIEFLLGCSPMLEKLYVSFTEHITHGFYLKKLIKLNELRRASEKVQVICTVPPKSDAPKSFYWSSEEYVSDEVNSADEELL